MKQVKTEHTDLTLEVSIKVVFYLLTLNLGDQYHSAPVQRLTKTSDKNNNNHSSLENISAMNKKKTIINK